MGMSDQTQDPKAVVENIVDRTAKLVMNRIAPPAAAPVRAEEETKKLEAPSYDPSEAVRRTQRLIEQIDERRQERAPRACPAVDRRQPAPTAHRPC
jgi:hypothetical protein